MSETVSIESGPRSPETTAPTHRITVIGGGTGTATLCRGLREVGGVEITAIPGTSDNGGSSGVLRSMGYTAAGDTRQCLAALCPDQEKADYLNYRFGPGEKFAGHPRGNLLLAAREKELGSFADAVEAVSQELGIVGQVIPPSLVSYEPTLVTDDGSCVARGEKQVRNHRPDFHNGMPHLALNRQPPIHEAAADALYHSDLIVIASGNPYGSIWPMLSIRDIRDILQDTRSPAAMVTNLVNCKMQTPYWRVIDYAKKTQQFTGSRINGQPVLDAVLYNTDTTTIYQADRRAEPVGYKKADFGDSATISARRFIGKPLVARTQREPNPHDTLMDRPRNPFIHDSQAVAEQLVLLVQKLGLKREPNAKAA